METDNGAYGMEMKMEYEEPKSKHLERVSEIEAMLAEMDKTDREMNGEHLSEPGIYFNYYNELMDELATIKKQRQIQVLAMLKSMYSYTRACKLSKVMSIHVYISFYWDEITDLAELYPQYVRYTPPASRNMWLSGKHEILPEIMNWEIPR